MAASSARGIFCSASIFKLNGHFCIKNSVNSIKSRLDCRSSCVLQVGRSYSSSCEGVDKDQPAAGGNEPNFNRDPGPLFMDSRVQNILKRLTGMNMDKIFEFTATAANKRTQRYEFMTENALQKAIAEIGVKARRKLQMPPVLKEREPINEVLSRDPELKGLNTVNYVFTDISLGVPHRKRLIVVRDVDGTLRKASWEERDRMVLTFFPMPFQKYGTPRVFLDKHLTAAFDAGKYKFVLDRACHQYEPDDSAFIRICHKTYDHIDGTKNYDVLHSTRHYGPLVFHLAFYKRIDNILQHLIQKDRIEEAADVVRLYHILQPDCKSLRLVDEETEHLTVLKVFTQKDAVKRSHLELALQTHQELAQQERKYVEDLNKSHGHT